MLTQLGLSATRRRLGPALGRAVLAHHRARPALRHPEPLLDALNRDPAGVRGHHFPSASSLSIALSNSASANSFLRGTRYPCSSLAPVPVLQPGRRLDGVDARRSAACVGGRAVLAAAVMFDGVDAEDLAAG